MVYKESQCRELQTILLFLVLPAISGWQFVLILSQDQDIRDGEIVLRLFIPGYILSLFTSSRVMGTWVPHGVLLDCGSGLWYPFFPEFLKYMYANSAKPIWRQMLCL